MQVAPYTSFNVVLQSFFNATNDLWCVFNANHCRDSLMRVDYMIWKKMRQNSPSGHLVFLVLFISLMSIGNLKPSPCSSFTFSFINIIVKFTLVVWLHVTSTIIEVRVLCISIYHSFPLLPLGLFKNIRFENPSIWFKNFGYPIRF